MTRVRAYDDLDEPFRSSISREEWERRMDRVREYEAAEKALESGVADVPQVLFLLESAAECCEGEGFHGEAQACERAILILRQHYG